MNNDNLNLTLDTMERMHDRSQSGLIAASDALLAMQRMGMQADFGMAARMNALADHIQED